MRRLLALGMGVALAVLVMPGGVQAQSVIQVEGTIQAADCAANTLTLNAADGAHVFSVSSSTAVFVDSAATSFCALSHYLGTRATVWVTASGDQLLAGRVDVFAAPAIPEPFPANGSET